MNTDQSLLDIISLTRRGEFGKAMNIAENYYLNRSNQSDKEQFVAINDDYQRMTDYWQRGFDDPSRATLYEQLKRRLFVLATNTTIRDQIAASSFMNAIHKRPRQVRKDWTIASVRASLEAFVSSLALTELEGSEEARSQQTAKLYKDHLLLLNDLFDYIITSRLWKDALAQAFTDILLTPTIDGLDQQLIVSAITLSAIQTFDINKLRILASVYQQTDSEPLRQRALVGWALCLDARAESLYPELRKEVEALAADDTCRRELTELQMQLFYCLNAESDQNVIKDEIMPTIMKGNNLRMTTHGLEESEEDTIGEIINPEATEKAIDDMEQSMKRMADMQKQGSDIYFAGFAQMKRHPFYNALSNWFVPFFPQHPAISSIWEKAKNKNVLQMITRLGAFCDSDKYSFVLAFEGVVSHLPESVREMMNEGEAMPMPVGGEVAIEEQKKPAFLRRTYLQNLYRFFRLHPSRSLFRNPFDTKGEPEELPFLFFCNPLMQGTGLGDSHLEVASFLMKRGYYSYAHSVLQACVKPGNEFRYSMLLGNVMLRLPEGGEATAAELFRKALGLRPGNERALAGLARAAFRQRDYATATDAYARLTELQPDNDTYQLCHAICLSHAGRNEEALKTLFRLNYLHPDDLGVTRALAWSLTEDGRTEQAQKHYDTLLAQEQPAPDDILNAAFNYWLSRHITEAIALFGKYARAKQDDKALYGEFSDNKALLARHNITETEMQLMADCVSYHN